jgi:hypothetical protein
MSYLEAISVKNRMRIQEPELPLVSFLTLTYGRAARQPELLNESVWWSLNQDYPNIEVLVLNDVPNQRLWCHDLRVRVINWPERLPSLGMKYNLATILAAGSICCWDEDDDISLPNRASQAVEMLEGYDFWSPKLWLYAPTEARHAIDSNGYGFNCAAFRRDAMIGCFEDAFADTDARGIGYTHMLNCNNKTIKPKDVSYVYRWGVSDLHLSAYTDSQGAWDNCPPGPAGEYQIVPTKRADWLAQARSVAHASASALVSRRS